MHPIYIPRGSVRRKAGANDPDQSARINGANTSRDQATSFEKLANRYGRHFDLPVEVYVVTGKCRVKIISQSPAI